MILGNLMGSRNHVTPLWLMRGVLLIALLNIPLSTVARGAEQSLPGDTAKGRVLFAKYCTGCHGPEGKGDGYKLLGRDPANLTAPSISKKSDADLLDAIHKGRPNMPAWEVRLSKEDSRDVLAYVRSLAAR
jgi:mono/diheme cytochrome c family protein